MSPVIATRRDAIRERERGAREETIRAQEENERGRTVLRAVSGARARGRERVKRAAVGSTGGKRVEEGIEAGGITWARVGRGSALREVTRNTTRHSWPS